MLRNTCKTQLFWSSLEGRVSSRYEDRVTNLKSVTEWSPRAAVRRSFRSAAIRVSSLAQTDDWHAKVTVPARSETGAAYFAARPAVAAHASCTRANVVAGARSRRTGASASEIGRGASRLTPPAPAPADRT